MTLDSFVPNGEKRRRRIPIYDALTPLELFYGCSPFVIAYGGEPSDAFYVHFTGIMVVGVILNRWRTNYVVDRGIESDLRRQTVLKPAKRGSQG